MGDMESEMGKMRRQRGKWTGGDREREMERV